jgi:PAS domain S-box-containing protein/putative nucleotidyltransferase with HDIG domain
VPPETHGQGEVPYKLVFDAAPIAISVTRGAKVLYANAAYLEMFGIPSSDQLRDVDVLELWAPEWRLLVAENIRRRAQGLQVPDSYEADHLRKDGTRFPAVVYVVGAVVGDGPVTVGFVTDISERKRAEEERRARDSQFRTFVEKAPVAIVVSRDGTCLYANRKVADMVGRDVDELVGSPVYVLFAPHMQAESLERSRRRSEGLNVPPEFESVFQRADGTQFFVHLAVGPIELPDGKANIAFVTDITERRRADQARRESEAMRDTAERVALTGSWHWDIQTNVGSWSNGMFTLFDIDRADFAGDSVPILEKRVHPADLGPLLGLRDAAIKTGEGSALEFRVEHRNGRQRILRTEATVEHDGAGRAVAVTGHCLDVTEPALAAARLEAAAAEWYETFDAMNDGVAVVDGDGQVVRCNAATLELTGLYIDEIVGHRAEEVFRDAPSADCSQLCSFETGRAQTKVIERHGKWLRLSTRPHVDGAGSAGGGVLVVTDITQLRQAEQAARERSNFLEQLLKAVPVPVYYLDTTQRFVAHNEAYAASLGRPGEDLVGKTVFDVRPAGLAKRMDAVDRRLLARPGAVRDEEFELAGRDGAPCYTLSHKAVYSDMDGQPAGLVGVNLDVTGARRAEMQLVAAAAQLKVILQGAVDALGTTTELRDPYTAGHQRRVAELALSIACRLGHDEAGTELLSIAARLHDIGKMVVPAEILAKPGPLSVAEMEIIRQHPAAGAEIVRSIGFDPEVAEMILQHHERLDGSGYPAGLHGAEILAGTRILSVADVVEAMISHRPYRPALPVAAAVAELEAGAGTRYEAKACEAAISLICDEGFSLGQ